MIKFTWAKLPVDADGNSYSSLEAFQVEQIRKLITGVCDQASIIPVAKMIVAHKAEVIEILELTTDARPTARGVKKPRKPKAEAQPELKNVA